MTAIDRRIQRIDKRIASLRKELQKTEDRSFAAIESWFKSLSNTQVRIGVELVRLYEEKYELSARKKVKKS